MTVWAVREAAKAIAGDCPNRKQQRSDKQLALAQETAAAEAAAAAADSSATSTDKLKSKKKKKKKKKKENSGGGLVRQRSRVYFLLRSIFGSSVSLLTV